MNRNSYGRRTITAVLLGISALAIGAVFGTARDGEAASTVKPSNSAPPTISGTATRGLDAHRRQRHVGRTAPITYTYAWSRCDQTGGSCAQISGATASTYVLKNVDAGATLRVTVKATNVDGFTEATSVPTAVVAGTPVAPVTRVPDRDRRDRGCRPDAAGTAR